MRPLFNRRPRVGRLARRGNVRALTEALAYSDVIYDKAGVPTDVGVPVRLEALEALAGSDLAPARAAVASALSDPAADVKLAAVRAVVAMQAVEALPGLVDGLIIEWSDPPYGAARREAANAVVELDDSRALFLLVVGLLLNDRDPDLNRESKAAVRRVIEARGAAHTLAKQLVDSLSDPRDGVRDRARQMLMWVAGESVEPLIVALSHSRLHADAAPSLSRLHVDAALALGETGDARAVSPLIATLDNADPAGRRAAAHALGRLRDPRAVQPLIQLTRDEDFAVRTEAGAALDALGTIAVIVGVAALVRAEAPQPELPGPGPGEAVATVPKPVSSLEPVQGTRDPVTRRDPVTSRGSLRSGLGRLVRTAGKLDPRQSQRP